VGFDSTKALTDVTFEIFPGERVVLIGPGAAGKTDLLRMVLGLTEPDSGEIRVFGERPGSRASLQKMGAVLEKVDFPPHLKVGELIELVRFHFDTPATVEQLTGRCGFADQLDCSIDVLGQADQRWLGILLAFAGNPEAVIMDTPTPGMDVGWRRDFWNLLTEFTGDGGAALVSSYVLHEVEAWATRVILLHQGRILTDGTVEEIIREHGERVITLRSDSLPQIEAAHDIEWNEGWASIHSSDPDTVVRELARQDVAFEHLEVHRPGLEEVILALIEEHGQ
jgi:ABC-2 type transport system ATP-binding protein